MEECLNQHPQIEATGVSVPCHKGDDRRYEKPQPHDVLVVVTRDLTCHRASVFRMGYNEGYVRAYQDHENINFIADCIREAPSVLWLSYEAAVGFKVLYWDWVFEQLGLAPFVFHTEYKDGNAKYFTSQSMTSNA